MGYRIDYGQTSRKRYTAPSGAGRLAAMTGGCLLAFVLLTNAFWPAGRAVLRELLIPGDPEVTAGAFDTLIAQVRSGEDVADAMEAFCREILTDGQTAD